MSSRRSLTLTPETLGVLSTHLDGKAFRDPGAVNGDRRAVAMDTLACPTIYDFCHTNHISEQNCCYSSDLSCATDTCP
jgi:hypothetical protein